MKEALVAVGVGAARQYLPAAGAHRLGEHAHFGEHVVDFRHHVFAINHDGLVGTVAQRNVQHRSVFSAKDPVGTPTAKEVRGIGESKKTPVVNHRNSGTHGRLITRQTRAICNLRVDLFPGEHCVAASFDVTLREKVKRETVGCYAAAMQTRLGFHKRDGSPLCSSATSGAWSVHPGVTARAKKHRGVTARARARAGTRGGAQNSTSFARAKSRSMVSADAMFFE